MDNIEQKMNPVRSKSPEATADSLNRTSNGMNIARPAPERPTAETAPENEQLEAFRAEIQALKDAEMAKKAEWEKRGQKGEQYNPHFDLISPDALTELDAEIYQKFLDKTLTFDEFNGARNEVNMSIPRDEDAFENPRSNFYAYLGNSEH